MGSVVVGGIHAGQTLLDREPARVLKLLVDKKREDARLEEIIQLANAHGIPVELCARERLSARMENGNHQGVIAQARPVPERGAGDLENLLAGSNKDLLLLVLDRVTDPHNLGACLRTADAAGVGC